MQVVDVSAVTVGPCITVLMYSTQTADPYIYQFSNCSKYPEYSTKSSIFSGLLIFIDKSYPTTCSTLHKRLASGITSNKDP